MPEKPNNRLLRWLLALNLIVLAFLGARHLYLAQKEGQERHKRAAAAANIIVKRGTLNHEDAIKLMKISASIDHHARMSDADLDWCLGLLKRQGPSPLTAASRRTSISNEFC
jgi:hypothetical protein